MTEYNETEKDQQIATLYVADDGLHRRKVEEAVADYFEANEGAPSGATFRDYQGLWKGDTEPGLEVEVWVDGPTELEIVRGLRDFLQETLGLHCVCMKVEEVHMEHRQPVEEGDD